MPANPPPPPVLRVPNDVVRRRLLDAAALAFAEHGYDGSRLEEIARAAGFTKGAVYSNFGSKQELFAEVLAEHGRAKSAAVLDSLDTEERPEALPGRAAALLAQGLVQGAVWHRLALEFALRAGRDPAVREVYAPHRRAQRAELARHLREQAERLDITPTLDLDGAALILLALCQGLGLEHAADPEAVTGRALEAAVAAVLTGFMAPPPAR
ncbi:TetR/AcrR family transcriptional regulator [Streptomyces sp. NPDC092296]|uniref:TetR/AcrR family transcriptional regulator n=1 Tax=Streptomyces sp. NPDC092296 TaxID=3366012 RepID=UPI003823766B